MNFLAHTFLSCRNEELLIGNFLADFIKNHQIRSFSPMIQEGIKLHRQIDTFMDEHPIVLQGVRRLYPKHHKYASVLIDVFYDHFLTINWAQYCDETLDQFTDATYRVFEKHLSVMPPRVQNIIPSMIRENWLGNYGTIAALEKPIEKLRDRSSRPEWYDGTIDSLKKDYDSLNLEFNQYFPEIIKYVGEVCPC